MSAPLSLRRSSRQVPGTNRLYLFSRQAELRFFDENTAAREGGKCLATPLMVGRISGASSARTCFNRRFLWGRDAASLVRYDGRFGRGAGPRTSCLRGFGL